MPWRPGSPRHKPELHPEIGDVWAVLRQMQNTLGGLVAQNANVALAATRTDARNENICAQMGDMVVRLEKVASGLRSRLDQIREETP